MLLLVVVVQQHIITYNDNTYSLLRFLAYVCKSNNDVHSAGGHTHVHASGAYLVQGLIMEELSGPIKLTLLGLIIVNCWQRFLPIVVVICRFAWTTGALTCLLSFESVPLPVTFGHQREHFHPWGYRSTLSIFLCPSSCHWCPLSPLTPILQVRAERRPGCLRADMSRAREFSRVFVQWSSTTGHLHVTRLGFVSPALWPVNPLTPDKGRKGEPKQ